MPAAVGLCPDWDAKRVRAAAREARDAGQARRLLAIAAACEEHDRSVAAKIGARDPQGLRAESLIGSDRSDPSRESGSRY